MKKIFFQILLSSLSYFVPKKKNLLVLGSGDAKQFQGNPKYLYRHLCLTDHQIEFYWSCKTKKQQSFLEKINSPFINIYSWKGFFKLLRAKYLIIEKSSFDVYYYTSIRGRFNFVQTWHGSPFKKVGVHASDHMKGAIHMSSNKTSLKYKFLKRIKFFSRHKYKYIISPSEAVSKIFQSAFENDNIVLTGYPRNDIFFNHELAINDYLSKYKLKTYKKIILYAPTFRDNANSIAPFSNKIDERNERLREHNYLLIVKKHPWEKNFVVPRGLSNILDLSENVDDIQELLPHVHLLITDYSSSFFDHMLTGQHTIFYPYDFENYIANCRGIYFDYYNELQGPFAHNEQELFDLIFNADVWTSQADYKNKYQIVLDKYNYYKDGNSANRLLDHLFSKNK